MKHFCLFLLLILTAFSLKAQNFSNKGKDFWVAYGYHVKMNSVNGGNAQDMVLYFNTGAQPSRVKVYVYNNTLQTQVLWLDTLLPANFVFVSNTLPK